MSKIEKLQAELVYEQAAEKYRAAKVTNDGTPGPVKKYQAAKAAMSEARTKFREARAVWLKDNPAVDGSVRVAAKTVTTKTGVN